MDHSHQEPAVHPMAERISPHPIMVLNVATVSQKPSAMCARGRGNVEMTYNGRTTACAASSLLFEHPTLKFQRSRYRQALNTLLNTVRYHRSQQTVE